MLRILLVCRAWVIQRVCGGTSLRWKRGGWRRRDYCARDSASPRWPGRWASTASRSAAGRGSLKNPECAACARPSAPGGHPSSARPSCATSSARSSAGPSRSDLSPAYGPRVGCAISSSTGPGYGPRGPRLAHSAPAQLDLPASERPGTGTRRGGDPAVEESRVAAD